MVEILHHGGSKLSQHPRSMVPPSDRNVLETGRSRESVHNRLYVVQHFVVWRHVGTVLVHPLLKLANSMLSQIIGLLTAIITPERLKLF
jgi:hypothetical protein